MGDSIFLQFEKMLGEGRDRTGEEYRRAHNKAIFDAFNKGLNFYRPYFSLKG